MKFGILTVLNKDKVYYSKAGNPRTNWICQCQCGNKTSVSISKLRNGHTKSCGCLQKIHTSKANLKHGYNMGKGLRKKEYNSWAAMKSRCLNKGNKKYPEYGGRGISICDEWVKFENFIRDMGDAPTSNHTIDRINNNGNYEPENCRWATQYEQSNNQRSTRFFEADGLKKTVSQWADYFGISRHIINNRLKRGSTFEDIHKHIITVKPRR